jgi:type VI secretion system protein ImpL
MESITQWLVPVGIVAYRVPVWSSGISVNLTGAKLWVLLLGLLFIGMAGVGAILLWLRWRRASKRSADGGAEQAAAPSQGEDEIDFLMRAAAARLASSKLKIRSLPAILLLGESGSGKTSALLNSGLDPDQVSGQVVQDNAVVPTRPIVVWFTRQTVFVEAGGTLLAEPARWTRLVRRLAPGKLTSVLGGKGQAPRAALVCLDCDALKHGAADTLAVTIRTLHARLAELSQGLGISLPVYVLFNKLDRLPFFSEYFNNLTKEETGEVLGVTLPFEPPYNVGVYADQESKRLTAAFDELFYSLSDKRIEYLPRENAAEKLPGIYEFPREFRKARNLVVQSLVDLCRPSQLTVSPLLRGFYFAGRRTVQVEGAPSLASEPAHSGTEVAESPIGATRVFDVRQLKRTSGERPADIPVGATRVFDVGKLAAEDTLVGGGFTQVSKTREVQQWVFLSRFFGDVLLRDRAALGTSGTSTKVNFWRRFLLACAAILLLVWSIGLIVSYFGNRALLVKAGEAAPFAEPPANQSPSISDLNRLNDIGQLLDTLSSYHRDGAPLSLRWGLYIGDDLYSPACRMYARGLDRLLLGSTRASMVGYLNGLTYRAATGPDSGIQNQQAPPYDGPYDTLKTYLIATSQGSHARDDSSFASDLYANWPPRQNVAGDQEKLVKQQFDRYGMELASGGVNGCFSATPDPDAVANARNYLNSFPPDQRIYQAMLAEATSKAGKAIDFNKQYADQAVTDSYPVHPAFTKAGWSAMDDALKHPERYRGGERWVLGEQTKEVADPQIYVADLRKRYQSEFTAEWLAFVKAAKFAGYKGAADIPPKIDKVVGAHSALLMVLCIAGENTNVDNKDVANSFSSARGVVPADCDTKVIGTPNKSYTDSLFDLEGCFDKMGRAATPDDKEAARKQCQDKADDAATAVRRLVAANAGVDQVDAAVQTLLSAPITHPVLQSALKPPPPPPAPGAGDLCDIWKPLANKLPFNRNATSEATLQEFTSIFGPGGLLSKHKPEPAGNPKPNPRFLSFYTNAAAVQSALYQDGKDLHLNYRITLVAMDRVPSFTLTIGGKTLTSTVHQQYFTWTGDPQGSVSLMVPQYPPIGEQGTWAPFKFLAIHADPGQMTQDGYTFSIPITVGRATPNAPKIVLAIDAGRATELFAGDYFSKVLCVTKVTQ